MTFPRSPASPHPEGMLIAICRECRKLAGRRRFWSVGSMRGFVRHHLAARYLSAPLIDFTTDEMFSLALAGMPTWVLARTRRFAERRKARAERRVQYNPNFKKRAA